MKKLVLLSIGILVFAIPHAVNAQTSLFTTYEDFNTVSNASGYWESQSGDTVSADNTFSTDASTVNGLGNPIAPGAAGTSGSLLISGLPSGGFWGTVASSSSGVGGLAALQAVDPGYAGNGVAQAASGNFYIDYSLPDNNGGNYFQVGVLLQYAGNGYYGTSFASSTTDLGFTDNNGLEVYRATIPYTIAAGGAGSLWGIGFGVMASENYSPTKPWHIDNISVSAVPEPGTMALVGLGLAGLMLARRQKKS